MIRKAYLRKVTKTLESLVRDIEALPSKTEHIGDALRKSADEQLDSLRALEKTARKRISDLSAAGDEHWGKFKTGIEHALGDLRKEVRKAADTIKRTASGSH